MYKKKYRFQIHQLQIHLIQPGQTKETSEPSTDQKPKGAAVSNIQRIVDNKGRHMEKTLSQAQGDQPLTNTAKEDLLMKRERVKSFEQSNKSLEHSIRK